MSDYRIIETEYASGKKDYVIQRWDGDSTGVNGTWREMEVGPYDKESDARAIVDKCRLQKLDRRSVKTKVILP